MVRAAALFFFCTIFHFSHAEIKEAVIQWRNQTCTPSCQDQLVRRLSDLRQVEETQLNPTTQQIALKWKEGEPFNFTAVSNAMKWVGISVDQLFLAVTGTIVEIPARFTGDPQVTLVSSDDLSRFVLLSPIAFEPGRFTSARTLENFSLAPETYDQLMDAARKGAQVTIRGPLFGPYRHRDPMYLIIENLAIEEEEE